MSNISRRSFIHQTILGSGALLLSSCIRAPFHKAFSIPLGDTDSPIDRTVPDIAARSYFGPDPVRAHSILFNTAAAAEPSYWIKHQGPLIVGGGLSGLTAAFALRNQNPLVLEAGSHFGGNSQGQVWRGVPYSIGAAYIVNPEPGDQIHRLLTDLNLIERMGISTSEDQYALNGSVRHGLWHGGHALYGKQAPQVERLYQTLMAMLNDEEGTPYPDIPTSNMQNRAYIDRLDKQSFLEYLQSFFNGAVPEPLGTTLEQYCWSSLGGSAAEISAASALNFYTSELGEIGVFDSGNSRVTQTLYDRIIERCGRDSLRGGITVSSVERTESGVRVIAHDLEGKPFGIEAPAAIMCCPKFIAKKIVKDLPTDQTEAFGRLRYRSYLTAAVMIRGPQALRFYDLYLLKQQNGQPSAVRTPIETLGATDAIIANWHERGSGDIALLLYRALPYDGARGEIFAPESYERVRAAFEKQITDELIPLFGVPQKDIADIRITRWGHALPLAEKGLIASGTPELLRRSIGDRIYFANQDNWALPAFENAVIESLDMAEQVQRQLRST